MSRITAFAVLAAALAACATQKPKTSASAKPAPAAQTVASGKTAAAPAPSASAKAAAPAVVVKAEGPLLRLWGTVVSIDAASGTLALKDKQGRLRTFRLASGLKVTKGGAETPVALSTLKAGDRVTVRHAGDVAASVHVNVLAQAASSVAKSN